MASKNIKTSNNAQQGSQAARHPGGCCETGEGIESLSAATDRKLGRAGRRSRRYVMVRLIGKRQDRDPSAERRAVQIGFAVDRSGSMGGGKLTMAKRALEESLKQMLIKDSFAVVWFDDTVQRMEPCQRATANAVQMTVNACKQVGTGGGTALFAGWATAAEAMLHGREPDAVARVLLLTDGQANHGPSTEDVIVPEVVKLRSLGVQTSTIGIGDGYNEALLAAMAREGGGNTYYAADEASLPGIVAGELGEAKEVVAQNVAVSARPSAGVRVELLNQFSNQWTGTDLQVAIGDLVSEQELTLLFRLTLPAGRAGETCSVEFSALESGEPALLPVQLAEFELADDAANDAQPRNVDVDREVASQYAARARMEAVALNRRGRFDQAAELLLTTAKRIATYMGNDPAMRELVQKLTLEAEEVRQYMEEAKRKDMYTGSSNLMRSKDAFGSSKRTFRP